MSTRTSDLRSSSGSVTSIHSIVAQTAHLSKEFLLSGSVVDFKFFGLLNVVLELCWMLSCVCVLINHMFHWTIMGHVIEWVFVWVHVLEPIHDLTVYTIIFIILGISLCVVTVCAFNVYFSTTAESVQYFTFVCIRILRTMLFFPFLFSTLSPLRCGYLDGSLTWNQFHELSEDEIPSCVAFPYTLYFISGFVLTFLLLVFSSLDILFFLDKFKNFNYLTSTCDGRFHFMLYAAIVFQVVSFHIFEEWEHFVALFSLLIFVLLTFLYIRMTPHYSKFYSIVWVNFLGILVCVQLAFVVVDWSKIYWTYFIFLCIFIILPIVNTMMLTRYCCLKTLYGGREKLIRLNLFVCWTASDVGLICHLNKKRKLVIANILKHKRFLKSKRMCHIVFPMIQSDRGFATHVIRHLQSLNGTALWDTSFATFFYINKLSEIHQTVNGMDGKSLRILKRISNYEGRLGGLYQRIFEIMLDQRNQHGMRGAFITGGGSSNYSSVFTSLVFYTNYIRKSFEALMKHSPSARIYRRYAEYLSNFENDQAFAEILLEEAKRMEVSKSVYATTASDVGGSVVYSASVINSTKARKKNVVVPINSNSLNTANECPPSQPQTIEDGLGDDDDDVGEDSSEKQSVSEKGSSADQDKILEEDDDDSSSNGYVKKKEEEEERKVEEIMLSGNPKSPPESLESILSKNPYSQPSSFPQDYSEHKQPRVEEPISFSKTDFGRGPSVVVGGGRATSSKWGGSSFFRGRKGGSGHVGKDKGQRNFLSSYCSCCSILITGFLFFAFVVTLFVCSLLSKSQFESVVENIDELSEFRVLSIDIPYYSRKLQTSSYDATRTPLEMERNTELYRNRLRSACEEFQKIARNAYVRMNSEESRESWNSLVSVFTTIHGEDEEYHEHRRRSGTDDRGHGDDDEEGKEKLSVYQCATTIFQSCQNVLLLDETVLSNRSEGKKVEHEDSSFFFLNENHDAVYQEIKKLQDIELDLADTYRTRIILSVSFLPLLMFIIPCCLYCCVCCCSYVELRKQLKGLQLISKEDTILMHKKFSQRSHGYTENVSSYVRAGPSIVENRRTGNDFVDKGTGSSVLGENDSSYRSSTSSFSVTSSVSCCFTTRVKFCWSNLCCAFVCCLCLCFFVVFLVLNTNEFHDRNVEYNYAALLKSESRHLNFVLTDLLYRDDSLHPGEILLEEFEHHLEDFLVLFEDLKSGNEELHGLKGLDTTRLDDLKHIFYFDSCTYTETDHFYKKLRCMSLSDLQVYFSRLTKELFDQVSIARGVPLSSTNRTDLEFEILRSNDYLRFLLLENFVCENENCVLITPTNQSETVASSVGLFPRKLDEVKSFLRNSENIYDLILMNGIYVFLILGLPLILFCGCWWFFLPSFENMNRFLNSPRNILYLLPKRVLMKKKIFGFLVGMESRKSLMLFNYKTEKKEFMNVIKHSNYAILVFDKSLTIFYRNKASDELFGFTSLSKDDEDDDHAGGTRYGNLRNLLNPQSLRKILSFVRRMAMRGLRIRGSGGNFHGELVGVTTSDEEFRVLVDIAYCGMSKKFLAIIENVEMAKKKQILQQAEKQSGKTDKLLKNMLPAQMAELIKNKENFEQLDIINKYKSVTAIFADIVNFTTYMERYDPEQVVRVINGLFSGIDDLTTKYGCEKVKTIGDSYFAVCGVPQYRPNHALEAMKFSFALLNWVNEYNQKTKREGFDEELHMRVGMSSGPIVAGVIGKKKWCFDCWGSTINQASRMESLGLMDRIQVSRSTYEFVFDKYQFMKRTVQVQGVGMLDVYVAIGEISALGESEQSSGGMNSGASSTSALGGPMGGQGRADESLAIQSTGGMERVPTEQRNLLAATLPRTGIVNPEESHESTEIDHNDDNLDVGDKMRKTNSSITVKTANSTTTRSPVSFSPGDASSDDSISMDNHEKVEEEETGERFVIVVDDEKSNQSNESEMKEEAHVDENSLMGNVEVSVNIQENDNVVEDHQVHEVDEEKETVDDSLKEKLDENEGKNGDEKESSEVEEKLEKEKLNKSEISQN